MKYNAEAIQTDLCTKIISVLGFKKSVAQSDNNNIVRRKLESVLNSNRICDFLE